MTEMEFVLSPQENPKSLSRDNKHAIIIYERKCFKKYRYLQDGENRTLIYLEYLDVVGMPVNYMYFY